MSVDGIADDLTDHGTALLAAAMECNISCTSLQLPQLPSDLIQESVECLVNIMLTVNKTCTFIQIEVEACNFVLAPILYTIWSDQQYFQN